MSVTPDQILATAVMLGASTDSGVCPCESDLRSCISRAYYAALHAADLALPADLVPTATERKGQSSHQAVINSTVLWAKSIRPGRTEAIAVARNLPKLRSARKRADYDLDTDFTAEEAVSVLRTAQSTLASASRAGSQATAALSA